MKRALEALFPEVDIYRRAFSPPVELAIFAVLAVVFTLLGHFLPADGFIGFDWVHFFSQAGERGLPVFYPPWAALVIRPLTWELLVGLTLAAFGLAALKRARSPLSIAAAFFSLPVLWTVFLGQVDGIVLLGLLGLPWLAPLALIKPQVAIFAFAARRSYLVAALVFLAASLLIWGLWPGPVLNANSYHAEGRFANNIALGLWGLPLTLVTLWFSRGDMDMLMASGAFITPYLIPYSFFPLAPAIARLRPREALLASGLSWLSLSANWLGPAGWWLGWLFVAWLWICLARQRYPGWRLSLARRPLPPGNLPHLGH